MALYSHDTQGLGHIRRNLAIANALASAQPSPDILLLSGVREAGVFTLPANTDCVTLPSLYKEPSGSYRARSLSTSLPELIELRSNTLKGAILGFEPDVVIVDKVARGAFGELELTLEALAARPQTRFVLGLRDVLDDSLTARREWEETATTEVIDEFYDAVWVYGDPRVHDPVLEYGLPTSVAAKVRYTGYLAPARVDGDQAARAVEGPYDLCLVGGGQDGLRLASAFLEADHPAGVGAVVVTGPYMAAEARRQLERLASNRPDRQVLGFVGGCSTLIRDARTAVAMGGYNTTVELLGAGTPTLIVPRVEPRREQLVRAERLSDLELVDVCHPEALSARALTTWLAGEQSAPDSAKRSIDLDGLGQLPGLLDELCGGGQSTHERRLGREPREVSYAVR